MALDRDFSQIAFTQNDCKKKKAGFTLAEVLITLGIIGVVAAMTIPNLIANVKGHQYRSQFKKTLSTLSQAALLSQEQYGFNFAGFNDRDIYTPSGCMEADNSDHPETYQTMCALLNGTISGGSYIDYSSDIAQNYVHRVKDFQNNSLNFEYEHYVIYQLPDGSFFIFNRFNKVRDRTCTWDAALSPKDNDINLYSWPCKGYIDVNGFSLPNKEVDCSIGRNLVGISVSKHSCPVKNKEMSDIFPIVYYDSTVMPASSAARSVLNNTTN